jgi:lipopolysaccharide heptosyltransferase II
MKDDNIVILAAANLARIPFWSARRRPFKSPRKALILKPCCLSQVLLTTPLLATLSEAFPDTRFDWAVSKWALPAVSGNPRITKLIDTRSVTFQDGKREDIRSLMEKIRMGDYDTCFVPSRSILLCYIAWRAGISQRIGLNQGGRGFAYTVPVSIPGSEVNEGEAYLSLANAIEISADVGSEFYPSDRARTDVTRLLVDELEWQGDRPLVLVHPGGGDNPVSADTDTRWPAERYASLANRLVHNLSARVILLGSEDEAPLIKSITGLMSADATDLAGRLDLDHIGALAEVADLYIGNDAGPIHVAAASACQTMAIFGPTNPAVSAPYLTKGKVIVLKPEVASSPFSWQNGPSVDDATRVAQEILANGG